MPTFINRYLHIITQEANCLISDKYEKLNPLQIQVLRSILKHTDELCMIASEKQTSVDRHDLLNIITPISGYVDMLSDGWMGELSEQQSDRIRLISLAVHRLIERVRKLPAQQKVQVALS